MSAMHEKHYSDDQLFRFVWRIKKNDGTPEVDEGYGMVGTLRMLSADLGMEAAHLLLSITIPRPHMRERATPGGIHR